jgi:hypothetical protein
MVTVVDSRGELLAQAGAYCDCEPRVLVFSSVSGVARLLGYYFKGGREVQVYRGLFKLDGRLGTRWSEDGRVWWVRLEAPARSRQGA